MDVRCEKCGTEYELDESKLKASGVTVKCTSCGHMFKVRRKSGKDGASAPVGELRTWLVRMPDGEIRACYELTTLQQWITAGTVSRECTISRTGKKWKRLGDIAELSSFFEQAKSDGAAVDTVTNPVAHPRTVRRDGASKTARLPAPNTGSHGVPAHGAVAPKRTMIGTPGLVPPAPGPKPGLDDVTMPLTDAARAEVNAAAGKPWFSAPNTEDEKTIEIDRDSGASSDEGDHTQELSQSDLERPAMDAGDDDETVDIRTEQEITHVREETPPRRTTTPPPRAETPRPSTPPPVIAEGPSRKPARPSAPMVDDDDRAKKTGSWASAGKIGKALEDEGPVGPTRGLKKKLSDGDAAFVSGGAGEGFGADAVDDDLAPPRAGGGGAFKWIAIGSLAVVGAAAGVVFFVLGDKGPVASGAVDASAPIATAMIDAGPAAPGPSDAGSAVRAHLQSAGEALASDTVADLEAALRGLGSANDDFETALARGQLLAALAQKKLDAAQAADNAREGQRLAGQARELAGQAAEAAKLARETDSADAHVLALTADVLRLSGKTPREIDRWLRKAVEQGDGDRYVGHVRAMVLLKLDKDDEARKLLESLVDDATGDTRARYRLAVLDFEAANYDAAKSGAEAVLGIEPEHEGAKSLLERVAAKTKVSTKDPLPPVETPTTPTQPPTPSGGSYDSLLAAADKAAESGRCSQAMDLYRSALDKNPAGVAALTGLGYCHLDQKEFAQAQAKFRAALGVSPRYQNALYGIAEAYQQQGLKDKAIASYKEYLSIHPSGSRADSARRQIERLGGSTGTTPPKNPAPGDPDTNDSPDPAAGDGDGDGDAADPAPEPTPPPAPPPEPEPAPEPDSPDGE